MRNQKLIKTLGITLLIVIVLTWLIPSTAQNAEQVLEMGAIKPAGLLAIFGSFDLLSQYFVANSIIVLLIGALYGVMNKTGAYKEIIDNIVSKLKGNEVILLIVSTVLFILIPALTNIYFPLFILVPLFISMLLAAGYNKRTILLSTVGSILIGMSCNLSSKIFSQMSGDTETNTYIWIKAGLLLVSLVVTVLYAIKTSSIKKVAKKQNDETSESLIIVPQKRETENKVKVSSIYLFIILSLMFIIMILGLNAWDTKMFTTMHEAVMEFKIGKFAIFANIFGAFQPFGKWWSSEIYVLIITTTIVIGLVYRLKFKDFIEGVIEGGRKFISIAILIALVNLVIIFTLNSGFLATVIKFIVSSGNTAIIALTSMITAPFVVEQNYVAQYNMGIISQSIGKDANLKLIELISQLTFGITMLIAPTSVILVAGLAYLEENFVSWFKFIWKLATILIIAVFIAITVASLIK